MRVTAFSKVSSGNQTARTGKIHFRPATKPGPTRFHGRPRSEISRPLQPHAPRVLISPNYARASDAVPSSALCKDSRPPAPCLFTPPMTPGGGRSALRAVRWPTPIGDRWDVASRLRPSARVDMLPAASALVAVDNLPRNSVDVYVRHVSRVQGLVVALGDRRLHRYPQPVFPSTVVPPRFLAVWRFLFRPCTRAGPMWFRVG